MQRFVCIVCVVKESRAAITNVGIHLVELRFVVQDEFRTSNQDGLGRIYAGPPERGV
jgi:hypothetical protein